MKVRQMGKRRAAMAACVRKIWRPRYESFWWSIDGYEPTPQRNPRAFRVLDELLSIPVKHAPAKRAPQRYANKNAGSGTQPSPKEVMP